ncbi:MAG: hypothetical protein R2864_08870 [Syntrophotaleaceae bacterium]
MPIKSRRYFRNSPAKLFKSSGRKRSAVSTRKEYDHERLPQCTKCGSEFTYEDVDCSVCPECGHEWPRMASQRRKKPQTRFAMLMVMS